MPLLIFDILDAPNFLSKINFHCPKRNLRYRELFKVVKHRTLCRDYKTVAIMCRLFHEMVSVYDFRVSRNTLKNQIMDDAHIDRSIATCCNFLKFVCPSLQWSASRSYSWWSPVNDRFGPMFICPACKMSRPAPLVRCYSLHGIINFRFLWSPLICDSIHPWLFVSLLIYFLMFL